MNQQPTPTEQEVIDTADRSQERCKCGDAHRDDENAVTPAVIARMRGYLDGHPGHRFAVDADAGIVAAIIPRNPGLPTVLAWSEDLLELLDALGAPAAPVLS